MEAETQAQNYIKRPEQAAELQVQNDTESLTELQDGGQIQEQAQELEPETTGVLPEDKWRDALDDELLEGQTRRQLTSIVEVVGRGRG